jgi:hypothetical protein
MTDVAAGDLRYTFGTFPVIWGMPDELCPESPTSMTSRSRPTKAKHCSTSQSGTGSHTTTSVAPRRAAQLVASGSWMESLTSRPGTRSSNALHPNGDGTSSLALRAKQGFTATRLSVGSFIIHKISLSSTSTSCMSSCRRRKGARGRHPLFRHPKLHDSERKELAYDVVYFLNRHFTAAAEPVLNNNGFIDKYIGDGILAAFGTRDESPATTCRNAVRAALGMQDAAQQLSPVFEHEFTCPSASASVSISAR